MSARRAIRPGHLLQCTRRFTQADLLTFSSVSGDHNPIHSCDNAAQSAGFSRTVVHGMLTGALFSTLFASHFPGSVYATQSLKFTAPVYVDELVRAEILVTGYKGNKFLQCTTNCYKEDKTLAITGQALLVLPTNIEFKD